MVDRSLEQIDGGPGDAGGVVPGVATDSDRTEHGDHAGYAFAQGALGDLDADLAGCGFDGSVARLFHQVSFADADDEIAHRLRGGVAEEAVEHLFPGELRLFVKDGGDVGNHLSLDFPDGHDFRKDGGPRKGSGRKGEDTGGGRGTRCGRAGDHPGRFQGRGRWAPLAFRDVPEKTEKGFGDVMGVGFLREIGHI